MIDKTARFEITRLKNMNWSIRKIARHLNVARKTVKKYALAPYTQFKKPPGRPSKLAPFVDLMEQCLEKDPTVKATVVLQRLHQEGFTGKITIVRDWLCKKRGRQKKRKAYMRFESDPGQQMQIDWGHFGSLSYGNTNRKLYALAVIEAYSRMLYVEFTHSQKQYSLHQGLLNAFLFFGGTPKEIVVDNMLTAVTERKGALVRFNDAFLDFLRPFNITPVACTPGAPFEKGKIESAIKYLRQNFWPLRSFNDLQDVQSQVLKWLDSIANVRIHQTTGRRPDEMFKTVRFERLPTLLPDCRDVCQLKVHKDFAVRYDGNTYTVPPWTIGKKLTVKADTHTLTVYHRTRKIVVHHRCWQRHQRIEQEVHKQQVKKLKKRLWQDRQVLALASLGDLPRDYLQGMLEANLPIKKNVTKILALKEVYGSAAIITAIQKALTFKAYGADYIENILNQEMTPAKHHPPVNLKNDDLNRIVLTQPSLADYDTYVLKRNNQDDR